MKPYLLEETNWHTVKEMEYQVALLPWGATEAHNYHLPYGSDTCMATHVARRSAALAWERGVKALVLPQIAYGVNSGQMDIPFCMHMNPSTQQRILEDIVTVLIRHKVHKLVIVNGHGGNSFQNAIRELELRFPGMFICMVNWWRVCPVKEYFDNPGDHADEMETSAMMAIRPELVLPLEYAGSGKEHRFTIKGLREKWAWISRRWIYTTDDTGVGDPSLSTPEKGKRFLEDCIDEVAAFLEDFSKIEKTEDLYER
ncbi:MAG: creatininase family protein [Bacteroidales bacterium]|jgi:creatinine amidohydrolase|nr:creatininase family protein [Bacteroidales bacterium]OQB70965.1 MAG: Creatinine amidohydrolase [Bacteroidetes bacterium ADurb.Bin139]HPB78087.1 creatininase family protein [Bacteroidales bacterium]HQN82242.1 creatininase family protein [Bacteroidales bacterium]